MFTRMTSAKKLVTVILAGIFLLLLPAAGSACRMYAAIGANLPDGMLSAHLVTEPDSLYYLSQSNDDGWGIGYYPEFGAIPSLVGMVRGQPMALNDPVYTNTVQAINTSEPRITMAHVRKGTSGCSNVPDPHPFYRDKIGKRWLFEHNGGVSKTRMNNLIGSTYLGANPPNGSDIPECAYPPMEHVVDSELYFLFVLMKIEDYGWNAVNGIAAAIKAMVPAETGSINFIMSDGETLWAFRNDTDSTHPLHYLYDPLNGYSAVASQYPSASQGNWIAMSNFQMVVLTRNAAPVVINDVTTYCPADINKDGQANTADLAAFALNFGRSGNGDLDFDGVVDGSDLASLVAVYGQTCP